MSTRRLRSLLFLLALFHISLNFTLIDSLSASEKDSGLQAGAIGSKGFGHRQGNLRHTEADHLYAQDSRNQELLISSAHASPQIIHSSSQLLKQDTQKVQKFQQSSKTKQLNKNPLKVKSPTNKKGQPLTPSAQRTLQQTQCQISNCQSCTSYASLNPNFALKPNDLFPDNDHPINAQEFCNTCNQGYFLYRHSLLAKELETFRASNYAIIDGLIFVLGHVLAEQQACVPKTDKAVEASIRIQLLDVDDYLDEPQFYKSWILSVMKKYQIKEDNFHLPFALHGSLILKYWFTVPQKFVPNGNVADDVFNSGIQKIYQGSKVTDFDIVQIKNPETTNPETTNPETTNPETTNPETTNPETTNPETTNPETTNPETTNPETTNPETTNPETTNPETTNPETTNPETTNPETTNPETTNPETTNPETTNPETTNPETTNPETTNPETTNPETTNPETTNPETTNPETTNPETTNPETTNPETTNPETTNPETTNPETTNPETTNPETTNPETTNPETTNPETTNPETTNPETTNPETTNPETTNPETTNPETTNPETTNPETTNPETTNPETTNPETTNPETTNPETTNPETTNPETTNPETTNPETTNPETTNPETTNPETTNPETTNPETTNPETTNPETTNSETTNPETTNPETTNPETMNPEKTNPEKTNPETTNPETTNPETTNPETTNPETTNPETTNPETTNPETTNPETTNPETTNPETTNPEKKLQLTNSPSFSDQEQSINSQPFNHQKNLSSLLQQSQHGEPSSMNMTVIIVVGATSGILLLVAAVYMLCIRKTNEQDEQNKEVNGDNAKEEVRPSIMVIKDASSQKQTQDSKGSQPNIKETSIIRQRNLPIIQIPKPQQQVTLFQRALSYLKRNPIVPKGSNKNPPTNQIESMEDLVKSNIESNKPLGEVPEFI